MSAIATFFADMQFRVDSSGLTAFRTEMALVKSSMGETLEVLHKTSKALKSVLKQFETVQGSFDAGKMTDWRKRIAAAARAYVKVMDASNGVLHQVAQEASKSQIKLSNFEKRLNSNIVALNSYATALMPVVLLLERLRGAAGSPLPRVGGGFRGGSSGAGGAGQGGHGGAGRPPSGAGTGLLETAGIMAFLKPMLPMGMGLGGMLGGGYAFRELITAGREVMAMELKMKAVSGSSQEFARNMKFVRDMSQEMGLDLITTGNAFANIVVTAKEKMSPEAMQEMFKGFNKYYTAVHMTTEDQRLANLAIQQMFGKDKIQAQEARLQMGQRVTPFIKLLTEVAREQMGDKFTSFDDVMKRGLLDPSKMLPEVAKKLTEIANTGGAYEEALKNSQVAQIRFNNSLKEFSVIVMKGGLDHLLAVMFSVGSEAVPMAAKAIKGLMHSIKNLYLFLTEAVLTFNTLFATTIAAAVIGMTFLFTSTWVAFGNAALYAHAAWTSLSVIMLRVAAIIRPIALMLTALESVSILVDSLSGEDISNSWIISLIAWVDLLFAKMENGIASINLQFAEWASKYDFLPSFQDHGRYDENGDRTPANTATELRKLVPNPDALKDKFKSSVDEKSSYLNYNRDTPNIAVHITLPQLSPAEANMLGSGDVKGFSASLGDSVYKALRDYTAYTG